MSILAGLAAIGSAIVAGVTAVATTIATTVGPAIASAATALATKLPVVLSTAKEVMSVITPIVTTVSSLMNLGPKDEDTTELGAKLLQDGTRKRMPEESLEEYLNYVRNEVNLDVEKYKNMSEADRLTAQVVGTTAVVGTIEEKAGVEIPAEFLIAIQKTNLTSEQVHKLIEAFAENGISTMGDMEKYLSNTLEEEKVEKVSEVIEGTFKELDPELSAEEIQRNVVEMKRSYVGE